MVPPGDKLDIAHIRAELQKIIINTYGDGLPPIPQDVPILEMGISSLELVEGMRRVYDRFGVLVSIRRVIEGQITFGSLALYIEQELNNPQPVRKPAKTAQIEWDIEREIPLAASQQHLAFLARYSDEAGAAFNESVIVRLRGPLDGPALHTAIEEAGNRYEALRTALHPAENALQLGRGEALELAVSSTTAGELDQRLAEIVSRPFPVGRRLFRAELLRLTDNEHVLVLVGHSLVLEQQALAAVLRDVAALYGAFARDEAAAELPPTLQWTDYLAMGETAEARQAQHLAETYWKDIFSAGVPHLELPADHARPALKKYQGTRRSLALEPVLEKRLRAWAAAEGLSPEAALCAAFVVCLYRLSSADQIVLGVESEPLYAETGLQAVAPTRNMLPLMTGDPLGRPYKDYAHHLADSLAEANRQRLLSLAELIQLLSPERDQSRSALFTVACRSWAQAAPPAFAQLDTSHIPAPSAGARYDLELIVVSTESGLSLVCDYSGELFEAATVSRWLEALSILLSAGLEDAETTCGLLPIMSARERELLLRGWNKTEKPLPDRTVFDLIVEQAEIQHEQTAIQFGENSLSYGDLLARTEQIAAALQARGVERGDRVAILLRRSLDLVPAMLAAWRLGAAYVPLDTAFPAIRLAYMLADADARIVITNREPSLDLPADAPASLYIEDIQSQDASALRDLPPAAGADSAYIIYTSGSTGNPKGVEIRHTALLNVLLAVRDYVGFTPNSSMLALTTISFDVSTAELFMPLLAGGCIEVGEDGLVADGVRLAERFDSRKPSHIQLTPSTWKMVLTAGWRGHKEVCLLACGEALGRDLAEQLLPKCRELWNFYGPTETTVYSTAHRVASAPGEAMRIGRPFPNTQLYILDARLQPVPPGAVGELYIGGDGLAAGYWRRPELTAEKFVFKTVDGRLYRTGDLARFLPDGNVVCLGRVDDQVKIHGVRIELGEIEAALRALDGVRDAVVSAWLDPRGDTQLVGHVILDKAGALTAHDLRLRLRERLPEVMIPPYILFAESFPLTANGKVRRAGLPAPGGAGEEHAVRVAEPPETETEKELAKAWAMVLGIESRLIRRDSDFMELGGHSLLMTLLMIEIRKLFKVSFSLREFFGASTLRALAALIDERRVDLKGQESVLPDLRPLTRADQSADWARQRMAFLDHEAQLPQYIAPVRGLTYRPPQEIRKVFLTGATGFLGAYLVSEILKTTRAEIYCLVRPKRGEDGKQRIEKQMRAYDVWGGAENWQSIWDSRVHAVPGDVTLPRLGMKDTDYERLAVEVDAIFHSAAHVNFIYPYEALRATNVLGIHEVIQFAFHARIKQVHHLSTAAIWPMGAKYTYYEKDPIDHNGILNLGYDEAKWVGEKCMLNAQERGLPVARYRPGEVGGDSLTGRCVTDHFVIACVKGFLQFGAFPDLDIEVDIAPVDYVARAMVFLAFQRSPLGRAFHLTNPSRERLGDGLAYLRSLGYKFDLLPFEELRDRLLGRPDFSQNALFAYQAALEDMNDVSMQLPTYDTRETQRELAGSGIACAAADQKLFETYLRYLQKIEFIPQPEQLAAR